MRSKKMPIQHDVPKTYETDNILPFNKLSRAQRRSILGKNKYGKNTESLQKLTNTHIINHLNTTT